MNNTNVGNPLGFGCRFVLKSRACSSSSADGISLWGVNLIEGDAAMCEVRRRRVLQIIRFLHSIQILLPGQLDLRIFRIFGCRGFLNSAA